MPTGYRYKKKISYPTTAAVTGNVFYLSLASLGEISAKLFKADGSDILVTTLAGVPCKRELVAGTFSKAAATPAGELYFVGNAGAAGTDFLIWFGNPTAAVTNDADIWTSTNHHACYHMQASSGTEPDKANSYDLTVNNAMSRAQTGLFGVGKCVDMEYDSPSYFSNATLTSNITDGAWTISFLTKIESLANLTGGCFISRMGANLQGIYLIYDTAGKINAYLISNFATNKYIYKPTVNAVITAGTIHHIAFTYDGGGLAAGMKLYVDGAEKAMTSALDTLDGTTHNATDTNIGYDTTNTYKYDGSIDEFRIATVERSANYIALQSALLKGTILPVIGATNKADKTKTQVWAHNTYSA